MAVQLSGGPLSLLTDSLDYKNNSTHLTHLAVIPSVTRGRAKMQKTVTPSLTRSMNSETDGHGGVITVALRCGESVVKLTILGGVSISHTPCLPCHVDLINNVETVVC